MEVPCMGEECFPQRHGLLKMKISVLDVRFPSMR